MNLKPKKRVLICYTELLHYRLEMFKALAERYDLTVTHSGKKMTESGSGFQEVVLPVQRVGPFKYQSGLWSHVRQGQFDAVVFFLDLAWISILLTYIFCPAKSRRVTWGLWVTKSRTANLVRRISAWVADANIFYSNQAADDFLQQGVPLSKIMVARNTFHIEAPERDETVKRDCIIFVGSFDVRKQNEVTVRAFSNVAKEIDQSIRMIFVGNGLDKIKVTQIAREQWCADRIEFHPGSTKEATLRNFYKRAICSVSFGQAGLSVLQSFGYGVPFVTRRDAISGGEIENIFDGVNGILCDGSQRSLEHALATLCRTPSLANQLGRNALKYYREKATISVMVSGFVEAIEGRPLPQKIGSERSY